LLGGRATGPLIVNKKILQHFFSKNLGSVHYPKDLKKSFGRSLVTFDFAKKSKDKILGGFL